MGYDAKVIKDSISPDGVRLTTLEVTLPRIVLSEFNTHRMLSRNSASSRAIPVRKRIDAVERDPFVPDQFGRNQKGMQASDILREQEDEQARIRWMSACKVAVNHAQGLADLDVHKQLANRLIEPFCWHTIVVSSTEWSNFFALRCSSEAQPEIRKAAEMMREVIAASTPKPVKLGGWHLPYVDPDEVIDVMLLEGSPSDARALVSAGRCARVSYLTHDGRRDPKEDLDLAMRLLVAGHMSPFEHAATPLTRPEVAKKLKNISGVTGIDVLDIRIGEHFVGNFRGWTQLRKQFPNEDDFAKVIENLWPVGES